MKTNKNYKLTVTCPVCSNVQEERIMEGDKYAFLCKRCEAVIENGTTHKLQEVARYTADTGGNVCIGFGGIPHEVHHRKWYKNG